MWNKQTISGGVRLGYWQFVIALGLSLLLHFLVIEKFYLYLPAQKKQAQVIQAQLVSSKNAISAEPAVISPLAEVQPEPLPAPPQKPKKIKRKKQTPPQENLTRDHPVEVASNSEQVAELASSETTKTDNTGNEISQDEAHIKPDGDITPEPESEAENNESLSEDIEESVAKSAGNTVNPNAYQYVATRFDVYTDKTPDLGNSPAGEANIVFEQLQGSTQYHIKSLIQPKGLVALLVPELLQTSEGNVGNMGLQPKQYLYQFGDKKNKTYHAEFDWQGKQLNLQNAKGNQVLHLTEGTQDLLSFMYQFMFLQPLQSMQMTITNGKKVGTYIYSFEGEESLETKMGDLNTIHLQRASGENDKKTEIWLALDYQYVPVKIRETEKDGKVYELIVSNLKTIP